MNRNKPRRWHLLVVIVVVLLVAGCSQTAEELPTSTLTNTPEVTPILPSATPEVVEEPPMVILLAPANTDPALLSIWQPQVEQAAGQQGLGYEMRENLTLDSLPQNLQLVVALPPAGGLQTLVEGLPQVQFVAVDADVESGQANLTSLTSASSSEDAAFVTGYIAAVQSEEYRVGMIATNSDQGQTYRQAFINGAIYFCGTCLPIYPPYVVYPVYEEVAPGAAMEQIQQAANNLLTQQVQIVHVDPQLENEAVLQMLVDSGFYVIGSSAPPSGLEGNWVASVMTEPTYEISEVLASALNAQPMANVSGKPVIGYTGASEARIANFNEIIELLETEAIDPIGRVD